MKKATLIFLATYLISIVIFFDIRPSYAITQKLKVTSSDFRNKGFIPDLHACEFLGSDKSPQLSFENIPTGVQSLALIMFDPDAPDKNFVHWVIFNIPKDSLNLEQGISNFENGTKQGTNGTGAIGYFGPCPPPTETHRYIFKVFALDTILTLENGATQKQLVQAMKGHIISRGKLVGLYKNRTNN